MEIVDALRIYVLAEDFAGYSSRFWAQHGISFLLELHWGRKIHRALFDTGTYPEPILFNAKLLNLNLQNVEYIVISHSHYDHTGGLIGVLKEIGKKLPVFAHPDIFKLSFVTSGVFRYIGPPVSNMKEEAEKLGALWVLSRDPIDILPGVRTLGEITMEEKVEYEKLTRNDVYKVVNGKVMQDTLNDEIGLVINTPEGLVVIGGCSHPGIVSMVRKAIKITNVEKIRAVIGGFHLVNASEERIRRTGEDLRNLGVEEVYTGHCTGLRAECEFSREFGERFHKLHAGMVIDLSER